MAEESLILQASTVAKPDRRWWGFAGVEYSKILAQVYSLGLWDLEKNEAYVPEVSIDPSYDGSLSSFESGNKAAVYYFTTPPKSYEITENAATSIVATQDGGKFIESHGNVFKEISIAGTVGLRPNPASSELIPGLNRATGVSLRVPAILQQKDDRGLDPSEKTGFDEIIHLRNLFRLYFDLKADPQIARKIAMVWLYLKESEVYIVEPLTFNTARSSANPLGWNYSIQLRTMYRWDVAISFPKDPLSIFQKISGAMDMLNKAVTSLTGAISDLTSAIDFLANLPGNLVNSVVGAITSVLSAATSLANSIGSFPKTVSQQVLKTASNACRDIRSYIDTVESTYTSTGSYFAGLGGTGIVVHSVNVFTGKMGKVRAAINDIDRVMKAVLASDPLWEEHRQVQVADYAGAYTDRAGEPPITGGSSLTPANIIIPNSAKEVRIEGGEDIRSIAKKYLGREDKWKLIAIINNLKAPYISAQPGDGVLSPKDNILIPVGDSQPNAGLIPRVTNNDAQSDAQGLAVRKYGRDLRLSETASGVDLGDLIVSNRGDLDVVSGIPNVEQGIKIKFATEQGGLALHPEFGSKFPIGTKLHLVKIQEFALAARRTLLSDDRVSSVASMKIYANGDQIITDSKVKLKSTDYQLPISFAVRS